MNNNDDHPSVFTCNTFQLHWMFSGIPPRGCSKNVHVRGGLQPEVQTITFHVITCIAIVALSYTQTTIVPFSQDQYTCVFSRTFSRSWCKVMADIGSEHFWHGIILRSRHRITLKNLNITRKILPWRSSSADKKAGFQRYQTDLIASAGIRSPSTTTRQLGLRSETFPAVISIKWPPQRGLKSTTLASLSSDLTCLLTSWMCGSSSLPIHRIMFAIIYEKS